MLPLRLTQAAVIRPLLTSSVPASEGTGVIASGPVRAICDGAGIHNILTKCHRSNNPVNVVKATLHGLTHLKTVKTNNIGTDNAGS